MADLTNIARPYARAAFSVARDKNQLSEWQAFFAAADLVAKNPAVEKLVSNPETLPAKLNEFYRGVLQSLLTKEQENFLHLLAANRRLVVLPEIVRAFNDYYEQSKKISKVQVITAVPAPIAFQEKLIAALTKRKEREGNAGTISIECTVDPTIIGGAIIQIGDRVIDGSIRNKLNRLRESSLR